MFMCAIHLRLDDGTGGAEGVIGEFIGCNMMMIEGLGHFGGWPQDIFSCFCSLTRRDTLYSHQGSMGGV